MTTTDITETATRATRLGALEAQVCQTRDEFAYAAANADIGYAIDAAQQLATLLQHTLQELAHLAQEISAG